MSDFWKAVRKGTQTFSSVFNGRSQKESAYPTPNAENTSPRERSFILGHAMSNPISDHRRETASFRNWPYIAAHAKAMQIAQATVDVGVASSDLITKGNEAHDTTTANEEKLPNHPLMRRFAEPNPIDNQMTYLYRIGLSLCLTGGAYIYEVRNRLGLPLEWWCLPRSWFWPVIAQAGMHDGGWRVTPTANGFGQQVASRFGNTFYLPRCDVLQIGWPDPANPAEFTSPLMACSDIIDIAEQRMETLNVLLQNAMNPAMILSIMGTMTKTQKDDMIAFLKARKQGPRNAGEVLLLDQVEKFEMGGKVNELDATTGTDQDRENVMGTLGVPAAAAGMGGEDGYSAISAKMAAFAELQIQPLCSLLAKTHERRARIQYKNPRLTVNISARRMDDPTISLQKADKLFQAAVAGGCTWNEWRACPAIDLPAHPELDELVPQEDPNAQAMQQGADAGGDAFDLAVPGTEGEVGRPQEYEGEPEFDLSVDMPGDRLTGLKQPDMQKATGHRAPSLNGKH